MIKYMLKCTHNHEFETWFGRGSDFDVQAKRALISCPICGDTQIEKALMAPNVHGTKTGKFKDIVAKVQQDIETNCDNVGKDFANEARAIHYGEKPKRGIYGCASLQDVKELSDEGVNTIPLPAAFVPKPKKKLN